MRPLTADTPKCLLDVGGTTPLRQMLGALGASGVDEAVIVVGWKADQVRSACAQAVSRPTVRFVVNPFFDFHGCECSMSIAHEELTDAHSLLIVEGDLLMSADLLRTIAEHRAQNAVLVREGTIDRCRSVVALGHNRIVSRFVYDESHRDVGRFIADHTEIIGESLQIWKFAGAALSHLLEAFRAFQSGLSGVPDMRNGLSSINRAIEGQAMEAIPVQTGEWINLNTIDDLERARGASWIKRF
jgi:NDP-sugar pyrophosphorylase family protein